MTCYYICYNLLLHLLQPVITCDTDTGQKTPTFLCLSHNTDDTTLTKLPIIKTVADGIEPMLFHVIKKFHAIKPLIFEPYEAW